MVDVNKPRREATYQDVIDAPEGMNAEIMDGELVLSPRPLPSHATAMSYLGADLIGSFVRGRGGPGGWIILIEPEVHFGKNLLVPDIAGWRRERMPVVPDRFTLAPDWVCEGLSKSTEKRDRTKKMKIYGNAGVRHLWLVDARIRTLEVYRLQETAWLHLDAFEDEQVIRAEPFDAIEFRLGDLWSDLPIHSSEEAAEYGR